MRLLGVMVALFIAATAATAHELRPAFLQLTESAADTFDILWKVPARGEARLSLDITLPDNCADTLPRTLQTIDGASTARWRVSCDGGLEGRRLVVDGLSATYTDALVRIEYADGAVQAGRLTPDNPEIEITGAPTTGAIAKTYFLLGVEHILLGIDHLLFVLALMLLIRRIRTLIETITAFTLAHSVTLAAAALGWAHVPQPPVEAVIALSIIFVATEILRAERGQQDFAIRYPWAIAFLFGLLHGFGFGGALQEIGLPQTDVPLALFSFNLGVEAGQLMFVVAVLAAAAALRALVKIPLSPVRMTAAYLIGSIAAFWFVERLGGF